MNQTVNNSLPAVAIIGAGRMGRGIATSCALAGAPVMVVDLKQRDASNRERLFAEAREEIRKDLQFLVQAGLIADIAVNDILDIIVFCGAKQAAAVLVDYPLIFEGVPEVIDAKRQAMEYCNEHAAADAVITSTTSTFLVNDLAGMVDNPTRFANAHWLNPAHLMPLVEISRGEHTSQETIDQLQTMLQQFGKVPVVCAASPGYIVPRLQALAMNEAARLVEEGVASAEDVDKAVHYGFGLRFAVLGLLEFIDWGGGDILYYASNYLAEAIDQRYTAPQVVQKNMHQQRNGLRDGSGFFDYSELNIDAYRQQRLKDFIAMLRHVDALPTINQRHQASR